MSTQRKQQAINLHFSLCSLVSGCLYKPAVSKLSWLIQNLFSLECLCRALYVEQELTKLWCADHQWFTSFIRVVYSMSVFVVEDRRWHIHCVTYSHPCINAFVLHCFFYFLHCVVLYYSSHSMELIHIVAQ